MNVLAILAVFFSSALLLSAPIAVVIGLSALVAIYAAGFDPLEICATSMLQGVDSFALLAIPFFILLGTLMSYTGIAVLKAEMEPATGFEPVTSSLPTKCSTD